jgi:hypothetical protein
MTRFKKLLVLMMVVAILASGLLLGCSKDLGERVPNIEPETTLSFSPDEGSEANYRVRMNWFGWDVDGEIVSFQTAWDKPDTVEGWSKWIDIAGRTVVGTDSIFILDAADEFDDANAYALHSFAVRAVDNEGAVDATPESLVFTAVTVLPETEITRGPASVTGPMVTFEWTARDRDGVIVAYDYRLFARQDNQWMQVAPDPDIAESITVGRDVTSVLFGPLAGLHKFEVWATDDAGAADQTPAVNQFNVNPELAGPKLVIETNVFGSHTFRGPIWPDRYNIPAPIFAGEQLLFTWRATANDYGGEVVGYRHAYDDTSTWPAWSIFERRFRVEPPAGRHSLYVSALDNANEITRARLYFDVVEASLNDYILVVDDYDWLETMPQWGTDEDRNDFYNRILSGYVRDRFEWEPGDHMEGGLPMPPDVNALRGASTVLWYCDAAATIGYLFNPSRPSYNALAGYLRVGGNIILCGSAVLMQVMGDSYPLSIATSDTSTAAVFVRDYLHIGRASHSGGGVNPSAPWNYGFCMHGAVPTPAGEALGFEPVYVDTGDCDVEPGKWWLYCTGGSYSHCGPSVEKLLNFQGTGLEIYATDAFLNQNYEGEPSVVMYLSGDNRGNACYMGFMLYYCQEDHVRAMIDRIMALFGEEKVQ